MRILYVEDNETNQSLVGRVVRARRHKIVFSEEGEKALALLSSDSDIDLVLLDIELAGTMTGVEVVKQMRARQDRRPVVAVTAYAMMGDRERFLEAGCDQYLPKPLVITDLLALLDQYETELASRQAQPANASSLAEPEPKPEPVVAVTPAPAVVPSDEAPSAEAVSANSPDTAMPEQDASITPVPSAPKSPPEIAQSPAPSETHTGNGRSPGVAESDETSTATASAEASVVQKQPVPDGDSSEVVPSDPVVAAVEPSSSPEADVDPLVGPVSKKPSNGALPASELPPEEQRP